MKKHIIIALTGIALFGFIGLGVHQVVTTRQRIQLKDIQIKDTSAKLKEIEIHYDTVNVKLDKMRQEKNVDQEQFNQVQRERDELKKQLDEKERQLQAKLEAKRMAAERQNKAAETALNTVTGTARASAATSGSCDSWIAHAGITEVAAAKELIRRESNCNPYARNPSSFACGVAQELPCGKSGCVLGDGACQVRWMNSYVIGRYGSWAAAVKFHDRMNWY